MPTLFNTIRTAAAVNWCANTGRDGCGVDECYADTIECSWQNRALDDLDYCHISLFCSLADWGCNITDVLDDNRYDELDLEDCTGGEIVSRYYTRFLLIASELFADLELLAMDARQQRDRQRARAFLSPVQNTTWLHDFHNFVNRVCKHKYNNLHQCNHHLPICFDDISNACGHQNPIRIGNTDIENGDSIQYPSLKSIIDGIVNSLNAIDTFFTENESDFRRICNKYDDPSCAETE